MTHFAERRRQLSISNHIYREMHDKTAHRVLPPVRSFGVRFVGDNCRLLCGSSSSVEGRLSDFDCTKSQIKLDAKTSAYKWGEITIMIPRNLKKLMAGFGDVEFAESS